MPLKVPITEKVIRERIDYNSYLEGRVGVCEAKTLKQYEAQFWAKSLSSVSLRKGKL